MHRYTQKFFLTLGALLLLAGLVPVQSASAIEYGGIGGRPAYPRENNPRTDSIFVHTVEPGEVIDEGVRVINNSNDPKTLLIYGGDYIPSSGGGFACRQYAEEQTLVGSWIELERNEVTLAPKTNQLIPFTISVPENAPVGENNGCILIEEKKATGLVTEERSGVSLSFRTGLRVALTVPGDIAKNITIDQFDVEKKGDGNILLRAQVSNRGNVSVDADVQIRTNDIFGRLVAPPHGGEFSILRDQTSDFNFELKKPFWGGVFASRLTVAYDPSITTELGRDSGQEKIVLRAERKIFYSAPAPLALAIELGIVLLLLFFCIYSVRRKRYLAWVENQWGRYVVQDEDTIYSLARKFQISWKMLVRVNHLAAPYVLRPGMVLRTPLRARRPDVLANTQSAARKSSQATSRVRAKKTTAKKSSKKTGAKQATQKKKKT